MFNMYFKCRVGYFCLGTVQHYAKLHTVCACVCVRVRMCGDSGRPQFSTLTEVVLSFHNDILHVSAKFGAKIYKPLVPLGIEFYSFSKSQLSIINESNNNSINSIISDKV